MKNRQDHYVRFLSLEENREWKSLNNNASNIVVNNREAGRITADAFDSFVDAEKELRAQTAPLMFIPYDRISKLPLSLWMEPNSHD